MKVNQKIKNEFPSYSDYCNESMVAKLGLRNFKIYINPN